jgi:hypothetical protein
MTCAPAPTAKSVSVAVGESETIRVGRFETVTEPLPALTVTGKSGCIACRPPEADDDAARTATNKTIERTERRSMSNPPSARGSGFRGERQVF